MQLKTGAAADIDAFDGGLIWRVKQTFENCHEKADIGKICPDFDVLCGQRIHEEAQKGLEGARSLHRGIGLLIFPQY